MSQEGNPASSSAGLAYLDPKEAHFYEELKRLYANRLYNSQLPHKHCEVVNKMMILQAGFGGDVGGVRGSTVGASIKI